jgi:hypothetical protein
MKAIACKEYRPFGFFGQGSGKCVGAIKKPDKQRHNILSEKRDKMENQSTVRSKRFSAYEFIRKLLALTIGGGAAFWVTTIATSILPVAAEYRAAYSNWSVQTVWIDSLFVGMIIGGCVSYSLLRYFEKTQKKDPELDHLPYPQKDSILKSVKFSSIALFAAVMLIDVPLCFHASEVAFRYLLIGVMFNAARFLILGFVIGILYKRLYGTN